MGPVSDRIIRDAGTPDSSWLPWLAAQPIRPASMADLCPDTARLVVVAPHPDDEVLACGGLLAHRAALGLPSIVVAVTDGEASHGTGDTLSCARLAARRAEESGAGLRSLGLSPSSVIRLCMPDGGVAGLTASLAQKLRPLLKASDVVVTTWQRDGHPDHEATSQATAAVCAQLGCRLLQAPVWMWHWAEPGDVRIPWKSLVVFGLPDAALHAKRLALAHHRSQLEERPDGQGPVLIPSIMQRATREHEFFFTSEPAHA